MNFFRILAGCDPSITSSMGEERTFNFFLLISICVTIFQSAQASYFLTTSRIWEPIEWKTASRSSILAYSIKVYDSSSHLNILTSYIKTNVYLYVLPYLPIYVVFVYLHIYTNILPDIIPENFFHWKIKKNLLLIIK